MCHRGGQCEICEIKILEKARVWVPRAEGPCNGAADPSLFLDGKESVAPPPAKEQEQCWAGQANAPRP